MSLRNTRSIAEKAVSVDQLIDVRDQAGNASFDLILSKLLLCFNEKLEYVLLSDIQSARIGESDVDMYVFSVEKAKTAIFSFCERYGFKFIQCYQHATGECCFIAHQANNKTVILKGPDLLRYFTWKSRRFVLSFHDLVARPRNTEEGCFRLAPSSYFIYSIVRRIDKGSIEIRHIRELEKIWQRDPEGVECALRQIFADQHADLIINAATTRLWAPVTSRMSELQKALPVRKMISMGRLRWIVTRTIRRLVYPCGLCIAFIGPDGSGKSTVIDRVLADIAPAFRHTRTMHLRPRLLSREGGAPISDPHGQPPRGTVSSILKIGYWLGDYLIGWWVKVRPMLVRSTVVAFDRYYHDLLVDPRRYRYGGPIRLAKLAGFLIPKPDLWIMLIAPADVVQARKQEVSPAETARQCTAYRAMAEKLANVVIVDASQPLDAVVSDASRAILTFMVKRIGRRHGR